MIFKNQFNHLIFNDLKLSAPPKSGCADRPKPKNWLKKPPIFFEKIFEKIFRQQKKISRSTIFELAIQQNRQVK